MGLETTDAMDVDGDKQVEDVEHERIQHRSSSKQLHSPSPRRKLRSATNNQRLSDISDELLDENDTFQDEEVESELASYGWERRRWREESVRRHLLLPHLMSGYLQLGFNVAMIAFIMYTLASFVNSVHYDIDNRVSEYSSDVLSEMAECSKNYRDNRCGTKDEVPVLRATCSMWERCMARDPYTVGRTKLSAHTLGEILNSFVEPLSYKTMGFFTLFLFGFMIASNVAFKLGSSKPGLATAALRLSSDRMPEGALTPSESPRLRLKRRPSSSPYHKITSSPSTSLHTRY